MYPYIPLTEAEKAQMLQKIGAPSVTSLFKSIPDGLMLDALDLPEGKPELEVQAILSSIAQKNKSIQDLTCFLGAGSYDHYIPSICSHLVGRAEFYTAYTPYQPEVSQGTLQSVFEYQSMMCELTQMDVSNISMYDGSTALAEACVMAIETTKRKKILLSQTVHPDSRALLHTYAHYRGYDVIELPVADGVTDVEKTKALLDKDVAAVVIQTPNFFGIVEDLTDMEKMVHENKSLLIMSVDPLSLGILKSPGEWGADIVVGDSQCFGAPLSFGGPYLGFLHTTKKLMRKMPGRIVGETVDTEGNRGFVLTLQTREQHIRREKATSNICSDQTLMAINAAVYLATLGKQGIKEVATQCIQKSHYLYNQLVEKNIAKPVFHQPFFKEFTLQFDKDYDTITDRLLDHHILGGYNVGHHYEHYKNSILFCVTEKRSKQEMDQLVSALEVVK